VTEGFSGRAVIVTGASSGIGRCIAVELARAGAELWLVGRSAEELDMTAQMIAAAGGPTAHPAVIDLRTRGKLSDLIKEVGSTHPHLFALVSNAGVMHPEPILAGTIDRWQAMLDINVMAMLEGCQAAVLQMRKHGKPGHLINIGSLQGRFEVPGVYGISKKAAEMITASLRAELERDDIRITTIVPGGFTTQLARGIVPEQLAAMVERFAANGMEFNGPGSERFLADPQHIANMVRYILAQPIELNIEEVVIRPPVDSKA
jgi:NADP-dependent 3-hydroxy acid dehydrogenase YdfG